MPFFSTIYTIKINIQNICRNSEVYLHNATFTFSYLRKIYRKNYILF